MSLTDTTPSVQSYVSYTRHPYGDGALLITAGDTFCIFSALITF